eukprot:489138_1
MVCLHVDGVSIECPPFNIFKQCHEHYQNMFKNNGNGMDVQIETQHSSAFPTVFEHCGYLDVRTKETKPWKRRYFVVNNNLLLTASTPHAQKLDRVIPLEGSTVKSTSDVFLYINFELFVRKHCVYFRAKSSESGAKWINALQKASNLKIKDIYRFVYTLGQSKLAHSKVVAAIHRESNEHSAIKILRKKSLNKQKSVKNSIEIVKKIENKFLVRLYEL